MTLHTALAQAGILSTEEISFLRRVFEKMALEGDTDLERDARASTLVNLYRSGLSTEDELLKAFGYDVDTEAPAPG